jgi:hypothetical protein
MKHYDTIRYVAISINVTKRVLQTWRSGKELGAVCRSILAEVWVPGVNAGLPVAWRLLIFFIDMVKLGRVIGNPAVNPDFLHTASAF